MRRLLAGLATVGLTATMLAAGAIPGATAKGGEVGGHGSQYLLSNSISTAAEIDFAYGRPGDEVYVGDWDGDGTDTLAVRRGATFYVNNKLSGGDADHVFTYGRAGDTVLVGDWNGDGKDTLAVRRGKVYHVKNDLAGGPADQVIAYGRETDTILVGDWNGNGRDTFAVRRGKVYHVKNSMAGGNADHVIAYGREGDDVLVGDWDGDGKDTFAVRRGPTYYLKNTIAGGNADRTVTFGRATDTALVGDWNGDGIDTLGLRRDPAPAATPTPSGMSREAAAALAALEDIPVTTREAGGYDRSRFGSGWATVNGCDTRNRVLARDLFNLVYRDDCIVETGTLNDPYTGRRIDFVRGVGTSNAVQIDHVVAVSSAWRMGANTWTDAQRRAFYNDMDNLLAVDGPTNGSKSDKTLGEWQPPNAAFRCEYAITYIEVTDDYDLALKPIDVQYAEEFLPAC